MGNPNSNALVAGQRQKQKFSVALQTETYQKLIKNTLQDPERAERFIASISSAVATNKQLQECTPASILSGALLGESLNLSPSPQLGQYYLIPFKNQLKDEDGNKLWVKDAKGDFVKDEKGRRIPVTENVAVFVAGYRGYIQMALRTGQYRKLNVLEIKEGELNHFDPLNEEISCVLIEDFEKREAAPTTGYYAMFENKNGFRKAIYWSKQKMISHADKYSPAFSAEAYKKILAGEMPEKDMWMYSSFWYKDFDMMAKKTLIRQLLTHWGMLSTEFEQFILSDEKSRTIDGNKIVVSDVEEVTTSGPIVTANEIGQPEFTEVVEQVNLDDL